MKRLKSLGVVWGLQSLGWLGLVACSTQSPAANDANAAVAPAPAQDGAAAMTVPAAAGATAGTGDLGATGSGMAADTVGAGDANAMPVVPGAMAMPAVPAAVPAGASPAAPVDSATGAPPAGGMAGMPGDMMPAEQMPPMPAGPRNFEEEGVAVVVDKNVGVGFEATIASSDVNKDGSGCASFVSLFGQDPAESSEYIKIPDDIDMRLFSLYRPEVLEEGKKYPIATWGNGTCSLPEGQGAFLRAVASHGVIVIAGHSRQVGTTGVMGLALDWAFAANEDPESPYYQKFDLENVGAFGHSQGSATTVALADSDARVKSAVLLNGGTSSRKPFLAISGDRDIAGGISGYQRAVSSATVMPAGYVWYHDVPGSGGADGHLTLITEPARVAPFVAAWFRHTLMADPEAAAFLQAGQCASCGEFEYETKGLQ